MDPGRKICIVPRGKKTTKAVVEGLKGLETSCSGFNCRKRSLSHSQQLDMLIKLVGLKNMKKVTENWKTGFYTEFKGTSTRYVDVPNLQLIKVQ